MPSQDGLRLHPQGCPRRSWQALTKGGQYHPIGRRPLDPIDLTLEQLHLAPQREHLGLKLGLVSLAPCDRVEENSPERVEHRGDHGQ
jgi:hypothetical protein